MNIRIISGKYGRQWLDIAKNASFHPMSERMRGALFNKLGNLDGKTFLDAFAGSGAIGIEAASRGARSVTCVEQDKKVHQSLLTNLKKLGTDTDVKAIRANIFGWSEQSSNKYDVIVADPPYQTADLRKTVDKLKKHLNRSGTMVLSHSGRAEPPGVDGVVVVETRSYADGTLTFYQSH